MVLLLALELANDTNDFCANDAVASTAAS